MIVFLQRHPKLLSFAISLLTCLNKRVLGFLNWSMLALIHLKGLNPNPPPPPPEPEPKVDEAFSGPNRKKTFVGSPYMPSWVVQSFRDQKQHVINQNRARRQPLRTIKDPPPSDNASLEVSGPNNK